MSLPRTSSGKVRRRACRDAFLLDELPTIASWTSRATDPADVSFVNHAGARAADLGTWLVNHVAGASGIAPEAIDLACPITRYGLDSLRAIELRSALLSEWGVDVSLGFLLDGASLAELAAMTTAPLSVTSHARNEWVRSPDDSGEDRLTAGQSSLWYAHHLAARPEAYNIAGSARITSDLDVAAFARALDRLVTRHDSLRTSFPERDGLPAMTVSQGVGASLRRIDAQGWGRRPPVLLDRRRGRTPLRPATRSTSSRRPLDTIAARPRRLARDPPHHR